MLRSFRIPATVLVATALAVGLAPVPAHADDVRSDQWYLDALDVPKAHKLSQGAGVTIGLVDSGVDADHEDLKGNVKAGTDYGTNGKGLVDGEGHGTWTSSLIVGHGHGDDNSAGVMGIAPKAKIVSVGIGGEKEVSDNDVANAIEWLADQKVDIISVSMHSSGDYGAVKYATDKGIPVVGSAGNCVQDDPVLGRFKNTFMSWPASSPGAIPVSGTTVDGEFWKCSVDLKDASPQPQLGLSAPAKDLTGAARGGGYGTHSGTSGSAPIVAGTLALIISAYPDLNYEQLTERLLFTVDDKGPKEFDDKYGWGIVNPYKALTEDVKHFKGGTSTEDDRVPLNDQGKGKHSKGKNGKESKDDDSVLSGASSISPLIPILLTVAGLLVLGFIVILVLAKRRNKQPPPPPPTHPVG